MTLYLIGLGLGSSEYLTIKALKISEKLDKLYLDSYTSFLEESLVEELRGRFGEKLVEADRSTLEEHVDEIVKEAENMEVGILVPGDPLIATTHVAIVVEAAKRNVPYKIVHGVSAHCALISASCLQAYKFGRVTTIPKSGLGIETCYRVIEENMERGLHTLILLDTADGGLRIPEALSLLRKAEEKLGRGIIKQDRLVICLARIGFEDEFKWAGKLQDAMKKDYPPPPHSIILPGDLHFAEAEALKRILKADESTIDSHVPIKSWRARLTKYVANVENALKTLNITEDSSRVREVLELVKSYVEDSTRFQKERRLFESLAAISYAEGLLDCLRILGKANFSWRSPTS